MLSALLKKKGVTIKIAYRLVDSLVKMDEKDHHLLRACQGGSADEVKDLLEKGVNVNVKNELGNTPLIEAVNSGRLNVVKILINSEASLNERNEDGWSALTIAAFNGRIDLVKVLIEAGADVNSKTWLNNTPLSFAVCKYDSHQLNGKSNDLSLVQMLIDAGADVNATNDYGETPLIKISDCCVLDVARFWLNYNGENKKHFKSFRKVSVKRHKELVRILIKNGADVNLQNSEGNTSIIRAAITGKYELIKYLIFKENAKINVKNFNGETALHVAAKYNQMNVVDVLLDADADVRVKNNKNQTAFEVAVKYHNVNVAKILYKHLLLVGGIEDDILFDRKFSQDYQREIDEMKSLSIGSNVTIYKFLNEKDPNKRAKLFDENFETIHYEALFPIYANSIRKQLKKAKGRQLLLNKSYDVVKCSDLNKLPTEIWFEISQFLTNDDLKNIVKSKFL